MKKLFAMLIAILVISSPITVFAEEVHVTEVYDLAEVLSTEEVEKLKILGNDIVQELDINVIFLTANDTHGKSSMVYSDDFYDGIEGPVCYSEDGIICFVDLYNSYDYIGTCGSAIDNISDYEVEKILDRAFEVPEENYYGRLNALATWAAHYYNESSTGSTGDYDFVYDSDRSFITKLFTAIFTKWWIPLFVTLGFNIVVIGQHNKANKKIDTSIYLDKSRTTFRKGEDRFIRSYQTVSKDYYKPRESSSGRSSSRGSSHRSSSGRSHGGGGRRR